jgi:hypothetical protein
MKRVLIAFMAIILLQAAAAEPITVKISGDGSSDILAKEIKDRSAGAGSVSLRLVFEDGEMLDVKARVSDADAYLKRSITDEEFLQRLEYSAATRGPVQVAKDCMPSKGQNCMKNTECSCPGQETCSPGSQKADPKGCVEDGTPRNAHLSEGRYVCDEGLVWRDDLSGCEEPTDCPDGYLELEGKCYGKGGEESSSDACCILGGVGMLSLPVLALGGAIILAAGAYAYPRLRKKST